MLLFFQSTFASASDAEELELEAALAHDSILVLAKTIG